MPKKVAILPGKQLEKLSNEFSDDEVAEPVPITLLQVEELLLRSTYLQAKLLESQYLTARSDYMAQFDRTADVRNVLHRIEQATADFNEALNDVHTSHGTDTSRYVYDMDMKALVPRQGEGNESKERPEGS